jgi:hypothetical protein
MSIQYVLLPLFAQAALTFVLLFWMGSARVSAIRSGQAKISTTALGQPNWPQRVQQIGNCYANQFQLPVLFYLLAVLEILTHYADRLFVALSWLFVVTRLVHAFIHTGSNYVPRRFYAFLAGAVVLLVMWTIYAVRIAAALP